MPTASKYVSPKGRFARSVNIERDAGGSKLDGYLPTGRALDVIGRVARTVAGQDSSRAFSITGPYGTGKSSLAVFLDALLAPDDSDDRAAALAILDSVDPHTAATIRDIDTTAAHTGFVRAVVTASREPIAATVVRALAHGTARFTPSSAKAKFRELQRQIHEAADGLSDPKRALPSNRFIVDTVAALAQHAPVLLVVDEFGKNLEAFTDSRSDADLYLLQELVEWSHSPAHRQAPLITITMQHLAFEEYLDSVSQTLRREWAKVQGRFEDIPYVDTPTQTQHLIAQVHDHATTPSYRRKRAAWAAEAVEGLRAAGLAHQIDEHVVESAWPLHPSALLVLPELCARYGQNERTLFSFLASSEPLAVPAWLDKHAVGDTLGDIRLDRVYDYFVESAATMVGASQTASRWVEIETSIRDASGLSDADRRVLKAVGLLNLVSAGGATRASRKVLAWACADGRAGTATAAEVEESLDRLESSGRLTYRDFADELRLWRGSDLDIRAALDTARRRLAALPIEELLTATRDMAPIVAARHSTVTGTLRAFARVWDSDGRVTPLGPTDPADGLLVYVVGDDLPTVAKTEHAPKPVVAVVPTDITRLLDAAIELAAIRDVLADEDTAGDDWVARRELSERESEALITFDRVFEATVGHNAGEDASWFRLSATRPPAELDGSKSAASVLSDVCDEVFTSSPPVPSEMLNRHHLTSQGAKARRVLLQRLLSHGRQERFGIEGFPPERAMYDAVFGATALHRLSGSGFAIDQPKHTSGWLKAWKVTTSLLKGAADHRVGIDSILDELASPPVGLKAGVAPVLMVAALVANRDEIALYEHGTYTPRLTDDVLERFLRNPAHFQVKYYDTARGLRREAINALAEALGARTMRGGSPTVLSVVGHLVATVNGLSGYAKQTLTVSAAAIEVRKALLRATEPDVLLFETLPEILGHGHVPGTRSTNGAHTAKYAEDLAGVVAELTGVRGRLLSEVLSHLCEATGTTPGNHRADLAVRAEHLHGKIIDQRLRGLVSALTQPLSTDDEWVEYVAMTIVGPPVDSWTDDTRQQYLANVTELGGTFRRLEAINFDRRARDEGGFDALRVTVTRADGAEEARVVALSDEQRDRLAPLVDELLDRIDPAQPQVETIMALLAERLLPAGGTTLTPPVDTVPSTGTAN